MTETAWPETPNTGLEIRFSQGVLHLTFNRPEKKNAITLAMYQALSSALADAQTNPQIKAVVFSGSSEIFSSGNDLKDFFEVNSAFSSADSPVLNFLRGLVNFEKPLIAAVSGFAIGIGSTLLLHCDLVYASDDAQFALPFVKLGLCPEAASSLLLPRLMGHAQAAEKLWFGEAFGAEEAHSFGLVNRVLPPSEVLAYATQRAEKLAQLPTDAVLATKRLLKQSERAALLERIDTEAQIFSALLASDETQQTLQAVLNKSKK